MSWLYDFIVHTTSEEKLLDVLERFFSICEEHNLVISISKSWFFSEAVKLCGKIIDANGVKLDPASISGRYEMNEPRTADKLCQCVHAMTRMANSIPRFDERIHPLRQLLENAYQVSGNRTKKAIAKVQLQKIGWDTEYSFVFGNMQEQIQVMVLNAHRNQSKTLFVHTDASALFWAAVVTQCDEMELTKSTTTQCHYPLAFLSGVFLTTQEHWTIFEKEAFAIVQTFRKLSHLFAFDDSTTVFTNHRNLTFTFHPSALDASLCRHKIMKVIRWAMFLSNFTYSIRHISGEYITMVDIRTRWLRVCICHPASARCLRDTQSTPRVNVAPEPDSAAWHNRGILIKM